MHITPEIAATHEGHLTPRTDGRWDVADTGEANDQWGCTGDTECILSRGHTGPHCDDRETDTFGGETPAIPMHAVDPFAPVTLPAGTYVIADLADVLPARSLREWLERASHGLAPDMVHTYAAPLDAGIQDAPVAVAFPVPEGTYRVQRGQVQEVTSGLFGAVDVRALEGGRTPLVTVTFDADVQAVRSEDAGTYVFGAVRAYADFPAGQ